MNEKLLNILLLIKELKYHVEYFEKNFSFSFCNNEFISDIDYKTKEYSDEDEDEDEDDEFYDDLSSNYHYIINGHNSLIDPNDYVQIKIVNSDIFDLVEKISCLINQIPFRFSLKCYSDILDLERNLETVRLQILSGNSLDCYFFESVTLKNRSQDEDGIIDDIYAGVDVIKVELNNHFIFNLINNAELSLIDDMKNFN